MQLLYLYANQWCKWNTIYLFFGGDCNASMHHRAAGHQTGLLPSKKIQVANLWLIQSKTSTHDWLILHCFIKNCRITSSCSRTSNNRYTLSCIFVFLYFCICITHKTDARPSVGIGLSTICSNCHLLSTTGLPWTSMWADWSCLLPATKLLGFLSLCCVLTIICNSWQ